MSKTTQIKAKSGINEITVHDHESDSPVIPIAQIERLHSFRPDKVDWVFQQTEAESLARRKETSRIHNFVFVERILGLISALMIALAGLGGSIWLASIDHELAASAIGGTTLVSMVSAFIYAGRKKQD